MTGFAYSRAVRLFAVGFAVTLLVAGWCANPLSAQGKKPDDKKPLTPAQIEQLVAPIALYPDPLISQILMASTYPLEVVEADRWVKANPKVKGDALKAAMEKQSWDPSVKSLTTFPDVLNMMNDKLSWTQQLGDAFLAQQKDVLGAIQTLRAKADKAGNLKTTQQQKVEKKTVTTTTGSSETVIVIEQTNPDVIYIPYYDPMVVYGPWPYPTYPPVVWYPPGYVAGSVFWFATGVAVGGALWGNCNWGRRDVNINVNRYNSYNRTTINSNRWTHNSVHRKGVPYRNTSVANRYGQGRNDARERAREQYRGRANQDRRNLGTGNTRTANRGTTGTRPGTTGTRPGTTGNRQGSTGNRPATTKPGSGAGTRNTGNRSTSHRGSSPPAFRDVGSGKQVRQYSTRGRSSRESARSHSGGNRGGGNRGGGNQGGGRRR